MNDSIELPTHDQLPTMPIDYTKIILPNPSESRMRSRAIPLLCFYRTKVRARILNKELSEIVQSAIILADRRNWAEAEPELITKANSLGVEPEALFGFVANTDRLPSTPEEIQEWSADNKYLTQGDGISIEVWDPAQQEAITHLVEIAEQITEQLQDSSIAPAIKDGGLVQQLKDAIARVKSQSQ